MNNALQQGNTSILNLVTNYSKIIDNIFSLDLMNEDNNNPELKYCFKILIADDNVYSIISPMLKIYLLRQFNICLNLNIKDNRDKTRDVMAIYLLTPTKDNFAYIKQDLVSHVYDNYCLNFISIPELQSYNKFIEDLLTCEDYSKIYKITFWPINLSICHPQLYSLNLKRPYLFFNSQHITEEEAQGYFNQIANGIISMMFITKTLPVIKYRNNWHTEEIVKLLKEKFQFLRGKSIEMMNTLKRTNTVLILLDRDTDLPIMLHHASSLGSMIYDCLGLTRIDTNSSHNNTFQLDLLNDYIWNNHLNDPFYKAGELAMTELQKYQREVKAMKDPNKPIRDIQQVVDEAAKLSNSIDNIRENKLQGNILSNQSKCYSNIIDIAKQRSLGPIFEVENNLLKKRNGITNDIKKKLFDLLQLNHIDYKDLDEIKEDLYRMCLIYLLTNNVPDNEIKDMRKKLKNYNITTDALEYFNEKIKRESKNKDKQVESDSIFSNSIKRVMGNLSGFMNVNEPSIASGIIDSLSGNRDKDSSDFVTYDFVKMSNDSDKGNANNSYSQVIVFFIGGGSFGEFEYIDELLKQKNKNVVYGCDYLYRPSEFLDDLQTLAKKNMSNSN